MFNNGRLARLVDPRQRPYEGYLTKRGERMELSLYPGHGAPNDPKAREFFHDVLERPSSVKVELDAKTPFTS